MNDVKTEQKTEVPHVRAEIRRFMPADLTTHGDWLMKRLVTKFPEADPHWLGGWLRGMIYDNEHLFLYQSDAVFLAQVVTLPGIKPIKAVQEKFCWVKDKSSKQHMDLAADFYEDMLTWTRSMRLERMFVCEDSDVPKADIEKRCGRIFNTTICHVRV